VSPALGFLSGDGELDWLAPALSPDPGILTFLDLLPQSAQPASTAQHATVNLGPALLGLLAGVGVGLLRNRARPRPPEEELM
jgi:hypothetical protein